MSYKRSWGTFEADLQAEQSPYVVYGTPLPPLDPASRDDGSYVPVWKQEVTDERGRKRLHGAFTGGFSAGYFNTVGSKDGWTPAAFVSSKLNRRKDEPAVQQKPEDFMDDEDLADAEDAKKLATTDAFAGIGSAEEAFPQRTGLDDLLRATGDTMGLKLLRKMGWRDGQGVGPKIRRNACLNDRDEQNEDDGKETHLFAPENSPMISFVKKDDRKGLGFKGGNRLEDIPGQVGNNFTAEEQSTNHLLVTGTHLIKGNKEPAGKRGGFGVGVLNDNGSDDEDHYHLGPQISYNRVVGGDKKKKRKTALPRSATTSNPLLRTKPVFISKKMSSSKTQAGFRKSHDGRLPLDGFVLSDSSLDPSSRENRYPPPTVSPDWQPSKSSDDSTAISQPYQSTSTIAKASTLNPTTRASLLGEIALPGKSVFDFLTPSARARIAIASSNPNLPPALSEAPPPPALSTHSQKVANLAFLIPALAPAIAATALDRGTAGWMPYADNPSKRGRYRTFLEYRAGLHDDDTLPSCTDGTSIDDWLKELQEFAHAALIFKPITGAMASRFTPSKSIAGSRAGTEARDGEEEPPVSVPEKVMDPAEEAARLGMFGPLTRSTIQFFPTRLLCKRFNVPPPDHVQVGSTSTAAQANPQPVPPTPEGFGGRFASAGFQRASPMAAVAKGKLELVGKREMEELRQSARAMGMVVKDEVVMGVGIGKGGENVDVERNEALERERPGESVFKAIFGSDSEDD